MTGGDVIRIATRDDLPAIVRLLADDDIGRQREDPTDPPNDKYSAAFEAIAKDADNDLVVMERDGVCVGCLQITIFPGFDRQGARRGWIEGVRISSRLRGQGLGRELLAWTIAHARRKSCAFVQLAIDKKRGEAIRFYESLGFAANHEGMRLSL